MKRILFSLAVYIAVCFVHGQTIIVIAEDDKSPLPTVLIVISGTDCGYKNVLVTDSVGRVKVPAMRGGAKLYIKLSLTGFLTLNDSLVFPFAEKEYELKTDKINLEEVVVTAQYSAGSTEKAVQKIKVIDSKKIEAMGAQNLRDVLTNEMNVRLSQDNILGSSMSLQGISGQNVKILIDGVPVTGRVNGNIDLSQINMNNVERIEIVEGPLSVSYGTDALAGTINIIMKKTVKEKFSAASGSYYESTGHYNMNGKFGVRIKKFQVSASGGRNYFDGWRSGDQPFYVEKTRVADSLRFKNWKPKEQIFGTLNLARTLGKLTAVYTLDLFTETVINKGIPRPPYFESAFDDKYKTKRFNNSVSLNGTLKNKINLNCFVAYNRFNRVKNTWYKDLTTLSGTLTANPGDQDTSSFNVFSTRGTISRSAESSRLNYEFGYDVNHETAEGLRIKNGMQQIGDYALFSTAEYKPFRSLTLRPGLRFIHNTAYSAPLVPSLNARLQISKSNTLRLSYARGFRAPSLKELYFYFVDVNHFITGNENLRAEYSHNTNASFMHLSKFRKYNLKSEGSFFYNSIRNMISLAAGSGTQYSYFNLSRFKTAGTQLQVEFLFEKLKIAAGASMIGRSSGLTDDSDPDKLNWSPELKGNLTYEWKRRQMSFALFYKFTGVLPVYAINESGEVYRSQIQSYNTGDASVTKRFFKKKLSATFGCRNMFNVTTIAGVASGSTHSAASNTLAVGTGRSYFIKLDFIFTKF